MMSRNRLNLFRQGDFIGSIIRNVIYPEFTALFGTTVPNYQGMFLRGHGYQDHVKNNGSRIGNTNTRHQSGNLGEVQGDTARNWTSYMRVRSAFLNDSFMDILWGNAFQEVEEFDEGGWKTLDFFQNYHHSPWESSKGLGMLYRYDFDLGRMTAVANENRPVNVAVKYIIKAK